MGLDSLLLTRSCNRRIFESLILSVSHNALSVFRFAYYLNFVTPARG